jgi:hypothetical protein
MALPWVRLDSNVGSHDKPWPSGILPLSEFPAEARQAIVEATYSATPPPKWKRIGFAEIPSRAWIEWHLARGHKVFWDDQAGPVSANYRRSIPKSLREQVYTRDGRTCLSCGSTEDLTLDHIHPYSRGGSDDESNLQTLCRSCNSKKGATVAVSQR